MFFASLWPLCALTRLPVQLATLTPPPSRAPSRQTLSAALLLLSVLSGPVNPDAMPNGDGLAEGLGAAGGGTLNLNGALLPAAPPQSSSSPLGSRPRGPPPGVGSHASHPPVALAKSEGGSAEAVALHATDSLQSLRLSMPMQETELCKHINLRAVNPLHSQPLLI